MAMLDDADKYIIEKPYKGRLKKIATVFPQYNMIAMGTYLNKTGGLDCFPDNYLTQKTLWYLLKKYPNHDIIMEGVISSTIYSTYSELFQKIEQKYPDTRVAIISLLPDIEVCLKRIQKRNGGKAIKEELVFSKWRSVERNAKKFKNDGLISIEYRKNLSKEEYVKSIFALIDELKEE